MTIISADIQHCVFDLDNTLYDSAPLAMAYESALFDFLLEKCPKLPAIELLREVAATYARQGLLPSRLAFLPSFGLSYMAWAAYVEQVVDPREFLTPNEELRRCLQALRERAVTRVVVSNNSRGNVLRTLQALGIDSSIQRIYSPSSICELKPNDALYRQVLAHTGAIPQTHLVFGDRPQVDLEPAAALGMFTLQVTRDRSLTSLMSGLFVTTEDA